MAQAVWVDVFSFQRGKKLHRASQMPPQNQTRAKARKWASVLVEKDRLRFTHCEPNIPWVSVRARVSGKWREFDVKTMAPIRWRAAGEMDLRLVVIRPVPNYGHKRYVPSI